MPTQRTTLGIDLGTQSVKVLFYDFENRETIATASSSLELDQNDAGKAEQLADWWVSAFRNALNDVPVDVKQSVVAVSVSGQQHGFVPLDKNGTVIAPVKLWCDTSTQPECEEIMHALGGEAKCIEVSGNRILAGFTASKVLSLKKRQPDVYAQLDTILLPHDYLNFWLTDQLSMEAGDASGTGFLNIRTKQWSQEILRAIDAERDLSECLPTLRASNEFVGTITDAASKQTGLPVGVPVAVGGGDNMMGAIGTANLQAGRTTISLGTSGTVFAYADEPIIDDTGNISAFCSSTGGWLPLLCTMNCTVTSEIMRDLLNIDLYEFDDAIANTPIGSEGVVTLPFFNGERTPNLPNAKGCILGLDSKNATSSNLLRSGVEGASFALRFGIDELRRLGVTTTEIILTGGGSNSAVWRQMIADIMNTKVLVMSNSEGAAFGAALQAFATLSGNECTSSFLDGHYRFDHTLSCQPIEANVARYKSAYRNYLAAVDNVSTLYSTT